MIPIPYFHVKRELYSFWLEREGLHSDDMVSLGVLHHYVVMAWYFSPLVPEERLEQHYFSVAQGF